MLLSRRDASRIERWARCASKRDCRPAHNMAQSLVIRQILGQVLLGHVLLDALLWLKHARAFTDNATVRTSVFA